MRSLSVIIPARNEEFLNRTIETVLTQSREDTECIVVLDGAPPHEPLPIDGRLKVIRNPTSLGQRAAVNQGARLSEAMFIMKLDAHCILAEGYDTQLIATANELGREVIQVPLQYNLYAFDWVCPQGHRRYQSPSGPCKECGESTSKEYLWKKRDKRKTWAWHFDKDLHFQYSREYERKHREDYVETMSCLGACWFLDREWYWELGGMDEEHGSWGQMGTEIGCKAWLSGGRLICNRKTWFSHMFRTQGGDFGFPYPLEQSAIDHARKHSQDTWKGNKWPKAIHDLDWLVQKFNPPGWEDPIHIEQK